MFLPRQFDPVAGPAQSGAELGYLHLREEVPIWLKVDAPIGVHAHQSARRAFRTDNHPIDLARGIQAKAHSKVKQLGFAWTDGIAGVGVFPVVFAIANEGWRLATRTRAHGNAIFFAALQPHPVATTLGTDNASHYIGGLLSNVAERPNVGFENARRFTRRFTRQFSRHGGQRTRTAMDGEQDGEQGEQASPPEPSARRFQPLLYALPRPEPVRNLRASLSM